MTTLQPTANSTDDLSGFTALFGTALSMLGMLVIVAGSAVHMMG